MCLYINKDTKPFIAKKDIKCFKILLRNVATNELFGLYFNDFKYEIGKVYELDESIRPIKSESENNLSVINEAFHSYKHFLAAKSWYEYEKDYWIEDTSIEKLVFCRCIIPKGSIVYEGKSSNGKSNYASDKMKILEIIE